MPQLLPEKILQCGKVIGVLVDNSKRCWDELVNIAQEREKWYRADFEYVQFGKKRSRELHSLACSINYDRSRDSNSDRVSSLKGSIRLHGDCESTK